VYKIGGKGVRVKKIRRRFKVQGSKVKVSGVSIRLWAFQS